MGAGSALGLAAPDGPIEDVFYGIGGRGTQAAPVIEREAELERADNGALRLGVLDGGRIFRRRAVKGVGGPSPRPVEWLVAELDGVRVYVCGDQVVVTRRDIYP